MKENNEYNYLVIVDYESGGFHLFYYSNQEEAKEIYEKLKKAHKRNNKLIIRFCKRNGCGELWMVLEKTNF